MKLFALRIHIWLIQAGWMAPATIALMGTLLVLLTLWLPAQRAALKQAQVELSQASAELSRPPAWAATPQTTSVEHLAAFYRSLGAYPEIETPISTLFRIAGETGLTLKQGEYRTANERAGRYYAYRVILPVRGSYSSIRKFCDQVLIAVPYAALDELHFKRAAIGDPSIEAKLQFTLYFSGQGPALDPAVAAPSVVEGTR